MKSQEIKNNLNVQKEVFSSLSDEWWSTNGPFEALHSFNAIRVKFIIDFLHTEKKKIKELSILDVGCGGGLLCEPLARLGAKVTGVDQNSKAIAVAKTHAKEKGLKIEYINSSLEDLSITKKFDLITCMEVLEHVENVHKSIFTIRNLLRPRGGFCGSTINQTPESFLKAILLAEYVLKLIPKKTHSWGLFIKPNFLKKEFLKMRFDSIDFAGALYNPILKKWKISKNLNVNYLFSCKKKN